MCFQQQQQKDTCQSQMRAWLTERGPKEYEVVYASLTQHLGHCGNVCDRRLIGNEIFLIYFLFFIFKKIFLKFFIYFFNAILVCLHSFYVCMYGCVGSSFLCEGFL